MVDTLHTYNTQVRFVREYWTDVFDPMLRDYMAGSFLAALSFFSARALSSIAHPLSET